MPPTIFFDVLKIEKLINSKQYITNNHSLKIDILPVFRLGTYLQNRSHLSLFIFTYFKLELSESWIHIFRKQFL